MESRNEIGEKLDLEIYKVKSFMDSLRNEEVRNQINTIGVSVRSLNMKGA